MDRVLDWKLLMKFHEQNLSKKSFGEILFIDFFLKLMVRFFVEKWMINDED